MLLKQNVPLKHGGGVMKLSRCQATESCLALQGYPNNNRQDEHSGRQGGHHSGSVSWIHEKQTLHANQQTYWWVDCRVVKWVWVHHWGCWYEQLSVWWTSYSLYNVSIHFWSSDHFPVENYTLALEAHWFIYYHKILWLLFTCLIISYWLFLYCHVFYSLSFYLKCFYVSLYLSVLFYGFGHNTLYH